jgi:general stress protein 26
MAYASRAAKHKVNYASPCKNCVRLYRIPTHIFVGRNFYKSKSCNMSNVKDLNNKEAIEKLKELVAAINTCLFCTNLKTDDGATCRPMSAIKVCDQGNIWFFSEKDSDKNKEITQDKNVQLFFSSPAKSSYLVVNGEGAIILDKEKIEALWTPAAKIWFKEGKDDPAISIIKVKPNNCYYWDTEGNRMINFFKMIASVATGTNLVTGKQGALTV